MWVSEADGPQKCRTVNALGWEMLVGGWELRVGNGWEVGRAGVGIAGGNGGGGNGWGWEFLGRWDLFGVGNEMAVL